MNKKNIIIIGAGQLGSRHLQALSLVTTPLEIYIVDPSAESLKIAQERFQAMGDGSSLHDAHFETSIPPDSKQYDIAIIATNSDVRYAVVSKLIQSAGIKYMVLEKLLFQNKNEFDDLSKILNEKGIKAWVNCGMRTMPFYSGLKNEFNGKRIQYIVSGSQYGLVTNAIHYIDHMLYITGGDSFSVNTDLLDSQPIQSKRKGFLELTGTLQVTLSNGSFGQLTCYPEKDCPFIVEIHSDSYRCISRETEKKAWIASSNDKWAWKEVSPDIPYQSTMTADVVNNLLSSGTCPLPPYDFSKKTHIILLDALQSFLNKNCQNKYDNYPFT